MIRSALMNVMTTAAVKAGRGLKRDLGEIENLQVSVKGPGDFVSAADVPVGRRIGARNKANTTATANLKFRFKSHSFLLDSN